MLWTAALPFAAGSLAGKLGGRGVARHASGARLQQAFAVFAGLVALGMAAKALVALVHRFVH
jgi:hypothetical protein